MPPAVKYLLLANVVCYVLALVLPQVTYVNGSEPLLNVICGLYYFGKRQENRLGQARTRPGRHSLAAS